MVKVEKWVGSLQDQFPVRGVLSWWGGRSLAGRASPSVKHTTQILYLPIRYLLVLPQGFLPEAVQGISSFDQFSNLFLNAILGIRIRHTFLRRRLHIPL